MEQNCMTLAERYYTFVGEKNAEEVKKFLDQDVEFYGPMATLKGKDKVFAATSNFMNAISSLRIRAKFGNEDQAMLVYDVDMPGIITNFPGASLLRFHNGLIVRIELFYDSKRVLEKKEEIFS